MTVFLTGFLRKSIGDSFCGILTCWESVNDPLKYYRNNVVAAIKLIDRMKSIR